MTGHSDLPGASVIVLNHNGREFLSDCLESLRQTDYPGDMELILVDNGSVDGSQAFVEKQFPGVKLICLETNRGFAAGNNAGCAEAAHEIVAFVNSDVRVDPGWLKALAAPLAENSAGCTAGKILNWDGTRLDFGRGIVTFDGHAFQLDAGKPVKDDRYHEEEDIFFACGGCMAVRKELFVKSGGFDQDYFAYFEDVDFGWRLWVLGETVRFIPASRIFHHGSGTSSKMDPFDRGFLFEKNAFMTVLKNLGEEALQAFLPSILMTLLHRTYALTGKLADRQGLLSEYPYLRGKENVIPGGPKGLKKFLAAFLRKKKKEPHLTLTHPHSISQLRALDYIFNHLDDILEKREKVQAARKRPDEDIFKRFHFHLVSTYPGDEALFRSEFFNKLLKPDGLVEKNLKEIKS